MHKQEIEQRGSELLELAQALKIESKDQLDSAAALLKDIKGMLEEIDGTFDPIVQKAYETHKEAVAAKKKHRTPVENAERIIKSAVGAYTLRLEQARRKEIADRQAQAEAEERARREAEAKKMKKAGQKTEAKQLLAQPVFVTVAAPPKVEKAQGVSTTIFYDFEIVDATKIPLQFMMPDEKKIRAYVNSMRAQAVIPGVRVFENNRVSVR